MSDNREPVKWITVRGAHVPIYEGESNYDALDRFYRERRQKKSVKVGDKEVSVKKSIETISEQIQGMSDKELSDYIMKNFIPEDSYFNDPEYKALQQQLGDTKKEMEEAKKQSLELYKKSEVEYDEDDYKKLIEEFDGDKQLAKMMAKKTPEGEEHKRQYQELDKKREELQERWNELDEKREARKANEARKQRAAYINDYETTASDKVKDEYEGFQLDTGVTDYEEWRKKEGKLVEMSPEQYLRECAHNIFKSTYENQVLVTAGDAAVTKELVGLIASGTKMYLPVLDYKTDNQEGRHRAMAAMLLGIDRIPVLVRRR